MCLFCFTDNDTLADKKARFEDRDTGLQCAPRPSPAAGTSHCPAACLSTAPKISGTRRPPRVCRRAASPAWCAPPNRCAVFMSHVCMSVQGAGQGISMHYRGIATQTILLPVYCPIPRVHSMLSYSNSAKKMQRTDPYLTWTASSGACTCPASPVCFPARQERQQRRIAP